MVVSFFLEAGSETGIYRHDNIIIWIYDEIVELPFEMHKLLEWATLAIEMELMINSNVSLRAKFEF